MSRTYEEIARAAAKTLAPLLDPNLPAQTEYVLADTDVFDFDGPLEAFDTAGISLASLLVNSAKLALDIRDRMASDPSASEWAPPQGADEDNTPREKLVRRVRVGTVTELSIEKREQVIEAVVKELMGE